MLARAEEIDALEPFGVLHFPQRGMHARHALMESRSNSGTVRVRWREYEFLFGDVRAQRAIQGVKDITNGNALGALGARVDGDAPWQLRAHDLEEWEGWRRGLLHLDVFGDGEFERGHGIGW